MSSNLAEALARRRAPDGWQRGVGRIDISRPRPERPRDQASYFADSDLASRRYDDNIKFEVNRDKKLCSFTVDTDADPEASQQVVDLAKQIFDEADIDNNGKIDQIELTEMMLKLWRHLGVRLSEDSLLREPMDHHEKVLNGGRWITINGDIQKMMDSFDIDHDGWVDFAEVCGILGTEPWVKCFPKEARGGLDAALARVLREWQTTRADPVLIDRLHKTAAELQKLEEEKIEREAMIELDRKETIRRWELEKLELQRAMEGRNRFEFDATLHAMPAVSRMGRAENEYYALLEEQAQRLGMAAPSMMSDGVSRPSVRAQIEDLRMSRATTSSATGESRHNHLRVGDHEEVSELLDRCEQLEAQIRHIESLEH